jgi:hypothetical protein
MRWMLVRFAALLGTMLVIGVTCADRAVAGEIEVIKSDANARFVPLELSKAIVIDLPSPVADILVADQNIVSAVVKFQTQSRTRVYIMGIGVGQTNVYFFDTERNLIDGLNIAVVTYAIPPETYTAPQGPATTAPQGPATVVQIWHGDKPLTLSCTPTPNFREGAQCYEREKQKESGQEENSGSAQNGGSAQPGK